MDEQKLTKPEDELVSFVLRHIDEWRNDLRANYYQEWDKYERMWLGVWDAADKTRTSERSKIISPDTQQAIESYEAEMVEAIFGQGRWFDIDDDTTDTDKLDIENVKNNLTEDFKIDKVTGAITQCITFAAVYGKGIGEILIRDQKVKSPDSRQLAGMTLGGVAEKDRFSVYLKPIHPRNFFIDPLATSIEDAFGCAIEEMVSAHIIIKGQREGIYRDVPIQEGTPTEELMGVTQEKDVTQTTGQVKITKYYGLVPRKWLEDIKGSGTDSPEADSLDKAIGVDNPNNPFEDYADLVESIVVIANDTTLLKAEANPFMMKDRPVVAYDCDPIPGKFWGRGIAQKGSNMQSAIDAQIRMHIDSLALTAAPMMGLDATRLPRGFKFEIYPGRSVKFNGPPSEVAQPFKFGDTSPMSLETSSILERKFLQATGTLDAAGMAADNTAGGPNTGVSLAMSGIIKKNRRALMVFTNGFLIPFIEKAAWRYMQFAPDRYPVKDYKFVPVGTLGMIAREYEQQHLMAVMSTLGPESPIVPMLMIEYVEHSGLTNKQKLISQLQEMLKPNPEQEKAQKEEIAIQKAAVMAKVAVDETTAKVNEAKAANIAKDTELKPLELRANLIGNLTKNSEEADEFGQRVQIAELALKEKDIDLKAIDSVRNHDIVKEQMEVKREEVKIKAKQKAKTQ